MFLALARSTRDWRWVLGRIAPVGFCGLLREVVVNMIVRYECFGMSRAREQAYLIMISLVLSLINPSNSSKLGSHFSSALHFHKLTSAPRLSGIE